MARLRPRGIYWELIWSGPDLDETGKKRRHSESLGRRDQIPRKDAELALRQLQRRLFLEDRSLGAPQSIPFIEWATEYLNWHALQYPSSHYRVRQIIETHVLPGREYKPLDQFTDNDVEDMLSAWRLGGYKSHTLVKHLRHVRALFNRAVEKGKIPISPAATVEDPQILDSAPHIFYERDELEALYLASSSDPWHPLKPQFERWHAPAWKLLANTGMRRGEALIAKRKWAKGDRIQIVSTGEGRTKAGKWREVPLGPGAQEGLQALDELLGEDRDYLLPRIAPPSLSRAADRCIQRADLPGSLHSLRHTFISHLAMDPSISIRDIQLWAGHASIETTEGYMYLRSGKSVALAL